MRLMVRLLYASCARHIDSCYPDTQPDPRSGRMLIIADGRGNSAEALTTAKHQIALLQIMLIFSQSFVLRQSHHLVVAEPRPCNVKVEDHASSEDLLLNRLHAEHL